MIVELSVVPEPSTRLEGIRGLSDELRVVDEIDTQSLACSLIAFSSGDLESTSSLVLHSVSGFSVSDVSSSLISLSGGSFSQEDELSSLVSDLSEESGLTSASGHMGGGEGCVQMGSVLVALGGGKSGHELLELLRGDGDSNADDEESEKDG